MIKGVGYTNEELAQLFSFGRKNPKASQVDLKIALGLSNRDAQTLRFVLQHEKGLREVLRRQPKYRVLLAGDFHCGHMAGLTPKGYQIPENHPSYGNFAEFERETWNFFEKTIMSLEPFSHAIFNGDLIDGSGKKSKGTELITTDRNIQVDMAVKVIETVNAGVNVISFGTPYHTGEGEDFETIIAERTNAVLNAENLLDIGGVIFNAKHNTNGTSTPYGAGTPLLKDALWSDLWSQLENNPTADIVVRSHTHTFLSIKDGFRTAIILPALQGAMTKFGTKRCSKVVHWGFAYADIYEDKSFEVIEVLYMPESQKRRVITL